MFRKTNGYKTWEGYLIFVVFIIAGILGIFQWMMSGDEVEDIKVVLTHETCRAAGGIWNDCGSACRGNDVDSCIEVCVEYCECTRQGQCPFNYSCEDPVNGIGICLSSS